MRLVRETGAGRLGIGMSPVRRRLTSLRWMPVMSEIRLSVCVLPGSAKSFSATSMNSRRSSAEKAGKVKPLASASFTNGCSTRTRVFWSASSEKGAGRRLRVIGGQSGGALQNVPALPLQENLPLFFRKSADASSFTVAASRAEDRDMCPCRQAASARSTRNAILGVRYAGHP